MAGFDEKIISLYARGLTTREIQAHLKEMYEIEVSPQLISNVTSEVMAEVTEWQNRNLERVYPIVYLDAMRVKVRENGQVITKAVYLALAITMNGRKELLGMWIENRRAQNFGYRS